MHLYNPEDTARQDGSGVNLFFTPNRRPYDAGIFFFGQWNVQVPPQETDHVISGGCSADCTGNIIKDKISVTAAFNHMHYTGKVNLAINTRLKATQAQQIGSHLFRFGLWKKNHFNLWVKLHIAHDTLFVLIFWPLYYPKHTLPTLGTLMPSHFKSIHASLSLYSPDKHNNTLVWSS